MRLGCGSLVKLMCCWFRRWAKSAVLDRPESSASTVPARSSPKKLFPSGLKLLHKGESPVVDIVFVHGLIGDREKTWTAPGAAYPWPQVLLPSRIPNARILTFGYDAYVADWRAVVSQNRIGNHSMNLLAAVATYRENDDTNDRPIVFVVHSLGGLVCEDALVASRQRPERHLQNILHCTRGIIFLGTPHHGSGLARWAEMLAKSIGLLKQTNTRILQVLQDDSEVLARIQDSFHTMVRARNQDGREPIDITCFFEELPLPGLGTVVPLHSAVLPGYIPIGIHRNHMDMTKFESEDDPGFIAVAGELHRWLKQLKQSRVSNSELGDDLQPTPLVVPTPVATSGEPQIRGETLVMMPYRNNPEFVGRQDILTRLETNFKFIFKDAALGLQTRVALYGLGGVGKSQIAIKFAYWIRQMHPMTSVFWINASDPIHISQGIMQLSRICKIPKVGDRYTLTSLVKAWLEDRTRGPWCMILDNADDVNWFHSRTRSDNGATRLAEFLPDCPHGFTLLTTRDKQIGFQFAQNRGLIEVSQMSEDDAIEFMHKAIGGDIDRTLTGQLVEYLDCLPLALAQAASFMVENSVTPGRYLQLLKSNPSPLLAREFQAMGRDLKGRNATAATWIISFRHIREINPRAAECLSLMACFDRHSIPVSLLAREMEQEVQLEEALGILKAFSLITPSQRVAFTSDASAECQTYDVHRLVHLVTQKWLQEEKLERKWLACALIAVMKHFPGQCASDEDLETFNTLLPHGLAIITNYFIPMTKPELDEEELERLIHLCAKFRQSLSAYGVLSFQSPKLQSAEYGENADVESMKLKMLVDKKALVLDMLGPILDKYMETAKGLLEPIRR